VARAERGRRERESNRPGWFATLLGAGILVVIGFAIGLVSGTAYEEPELVLDHWAGRTVDVPLVAAEPPPESEPEPAPQLASRPLRPLGAPRGAAAPTPAPAARAKPAPTPAPAARAKPEVKPAPVAAPPAVASAPPASRAPAAAPAPAPGGYAIQVGAFAAEAGARQLVARLQQSGHASYVAAEGGGARFKVRVGPLETRERAERVAARLEREQELPTWIVSR
jgi:DedD protein